VQRTAGLPGGPPPLPNARRGTRVRGLKRGAFYTAEANAEGESHSGLVQVYALSFWSRSDNVVTPRPAEMGCWMITIPGLVAEALASFLTSETKSQFGSSHARLAEALPFAAKLTMLHW
jgi:hypothetical protein